MKISFKEITEFLMDEINATSNNEKKRLLTATLSAIKNLKRFNDTIHTDDIVSLGKSDDVKLAKIRKHRRYYLNITDLKILSGYSNSTASREMKGIKDRLDRNNLPVAISEYCKLYDQPEVDIRETLGI